jgi:hypothetical protein
LFFHTLPTVVKAFHLEGCHQQIGRDDGEGTTKYSGSLSPKSHNEFVQRR